MNCRICRSETTKIADFGTLALTCVFPKMNEEAPRYPLTVVRCLSCGLVQLGETTPPGVMYVTGYGYKSGTNEAMVSHLTGIVDEASQYVKPGDFVLDIGHNDGTLLKAWEKYGVSRFGWDPCGSKYVPGCLTTKDYFRFHNQSYKVITSIAMFYDLDDPVGFARDVWKSLDEDGVWILEVQYAGALIAGKWDGICHEHLCYYGLRQILHIASRVGLIVEKVSFNAANGGSIRCHLMRGDDGGIREYDALECEKRWDWSDLQDSINHASENLRKFLGLRRVYALGASTKGNTLLQSAWLDNASIVAAIERNPEKIGRKTPGTNIPIMSEEWARENPPQAFLVLPYHFRAGILERYKDFRERGVKFIFPLPDVEEV